MATAAELERRVEALEAAQNDTTQALRWVVTRLEHASSVQDEHTLRLERIEGHLDNVESGLKRVDSEIKGLRAELPGIVMEAVREGIKAARDSGQ